MKNIIINILSTMVEFAKKYSLERVIVNISLQIEENSDEIVLKIEDNIKDMSLKTVDIDKNLLTLSLKNV